MLFFFAISEQVDHADQYFFTAELEVRHPDCGVMSMYDLCVILQRPRILHPVALRFDDREPEAANKRRRMTDGNDAAPADAAE